MSDVPVDSDDAAAVIPHRMTARLLTKIVEYSAQRIKGVGRIPGAYPLVTAFGAPSFIGLELGAQAAAALETLSRSYGIAQATPRLGHLVRIREASFLKTYLPVDTPLQVTAELDGAAPPLAIYRIRVGIKGEDCVTAILSTHSAPQ